MDKYSLLKGNEIFLDKHQLEQYIENLSKQQIVDRNSQKSTYPVYKLNKDFEYITDVYNLLNEHIKNGINIHPAGEWILDNYYIIEENVKMIRNEVSLKKYKKLPSITHGPFKGVSRIYVLASQIINYTNNNIDKDTIENLLKIYESYQNITMEEFWYLQNFFKIAIIQNIADICEKVESSQLQKNRVIEIIDKTIEGKKIKADSRYNVTNQFDAKTPFIEFMAYKLKRYGKEGVPYLTVLEEQVEKMGSTLSQIIKREHFSIAVSRVAISNAISSIRNLSRINFQEIFEKINTVEEILKQDPAGVYKKMSFETKAYYRSAIKEISEKNGISEMYIINKAIELAYKNNVEVSPLSQNNNPHNSNKKSHVGYYLISHGKRELLKTLGCKDDEFTRMKKVSLFVVLFFAITICISYITGVFLAQKTGIFLGILLGLLIYIPITEIYLQIVNYILIKTVKPTIIPKINLNEGLTEENATMVVIPTIIDSGKKAEDLVKKLEIYYLANKTEHMYFTILADCTQKDVMSDEKDKEIVKTGLKAIEELNQKYKSDFPKFHFLYRKREWCATQKAYLGWERKRGLLTQFNEFLVNAGALKNSKINNIVNKINHANNSFLCNSLSEIETNIPKIKYVITLDSDTNLTLNSGLELVGAMEHILNKPIIKNNIVVDGYGIIQPRIGIDLSIMNRSIFTEIFSQKGGVDVYSKAISDVYQDNFGEAIFTGKGIYDLEAFYNLLNKAIPENNVLSHDLLEGCYLKCGLATDILLLDGYPSKYNSYMARNHRWIRGDWQIISWILPRVYNQDRKKVKNPINQLSRFKIFENLRRSLMPLMALISLFVSYKLFFILGLVCVLMPTIIDCINYVVFRKELNTKQINFSYNISGIKQSIFKGILDVTLIADKAYTSANAIIKTLYRLKTKTNLLEWTTAEEAEKLQKTTLLSYYQSMWQSVVLGILMVLLLEYANIVLGLLWIFAPYVMWYISQTREQEIQISSEDKKYITDIAKKTWGYFKQYMNEENHYLPPDNLQEGKEIAKRTSSTNIGLGLLTVVSAFDFKFIKKDEALDLIEKMLYTIDGLPKWNGHLYNWYNTEDLSLLIPRYISTVDSGNLVGYLYVLKQFLYEQNAKPELIDIVNRLIENTDFKELYNPEIKLFSIGFNVEENKLTDSYYDFLASEARQASLVAIAKKDVESKHWSSLSRTLTIMNGYKGLVSWSGTAFEYLMPNINIKKYEGSLLDESCKFLIMCSEQYVRKLGIPWGISESAFNLRDLGGYYQYKAFGLPWLGLKRGLADDLVIAPYASILAITDEPKMVIKNLKHLEEYGMVGQYGFYEAIDFTPSRLKFSKKYEIVKTFMAHHQGLILTSLNNLINNNIIQKRFNQNPEIAAVDILLQEQMPENIIITKEKKERIEKLKYIDYEECAQREFSSINPNFEHTNVIVNDGYLNFTTDTGTGFSKYNDIQINRYKRTNDESQGIRFYVKNIRSKNIWSSIIKDNSKSFGIVFTESESKFKRQDENIITTIKTTISSEDVIEIREITFENIGQTKETLEVSGVFEPILSKLSEDIAHPAFNNLFINFEKVEDNIIINRRKRDSKEKDIFVGVTLFTDNHTIGEMEVEIDKFKFLGRNNIGIPKMVAESIPFSNKIGIVIDPVVALRKTMEIEGEDKVVVSLIIAVSENRDEVLENLKRYKAQEKIKATFELSKAKVDAENRYLGLTNKEIEKYQQMLSYLVYKNPTKKLIEGSIIKKNYTQNELWKYGISGDLPILLLQIKSKSDIDILTDVLKAYEYFKYKNIDVDFIILNEEENSYEQKLKSEIENIISNRQISYLINNGIYILNNVDFENKNMLKFMANLEIDAGKGSLKTILKETKQEYLASNELIPEEKNVYVGERLGDSQMNKSTSVESDTSVTSFSHVDNDGFQSYNFEQPKLYYNEYGGFSEDGKEFLIRINKENKLPTVWSHILANKRFGTLVTETAGGYTWNKNARLNRLTAWNNNQVTDIPSEIIYLKNKETGNTWTLGYSTMPTDTDYYITYGFGYARFNQLNDGVFQENEVFVGLEDSVKINKITLKNMQNKAKLLKLVYYIKPVLGEDEIKSSTYIDTEHIKEQNIVQFKNLSNNDKVAYISSSEKIISYTGIKNGFIGNGSLANPEALKKLSLNNKNGIFGESIVAIQLDLEIAAEETKELVIVLGEEDEYIKVVENAKRFTSLENAKTELDLVKKYWKDTLSNIQIQTPLESMNIMLNGWIMYQSLVSRMWARTGYYQSGGAFGFRDQLQDTLGLKYIDKNIMKEQIIRASSHQFIEGDVEHWWHEENNSGVRTRFSDDLLWLPYVVSEYLEFTGDYKFLLEEVPFVQGEILKEEQDESYDVHLPTEETASILEHCLLSIKKGINIGQHGLIKIGSGDWNDGFSTVGNKGIGESIWLTFFVYDVLEKTIVILENLNNTGTSINIFKILKISNINDLITEYRKIQQELRKSLNQTGWDGRWFRRAYMDNGKILGTISNEECKIDSIAQSWSIISNAADNDKKYIAFESLEKYLIDRENAILKLLTPAFEKSDLEPGYIKAYPPGIRENGGQYTHGCLWVIMAATMLGFGEKAVEYYRMMTPIEHARTREAADKYKVEPYVISADVYGEREQAGRGGWSWYTGSSSWYYKIGLENILGLKIEGNQLKINPTIPKEWKEYRIRYICENKNFNTNETIYNIIVKNPNGKNTGVEMVRLNGKEIEEKTIFLVDNGKCNDVEVIM